MKTSTFAFILIASTTLSFCSKNKLPDAGGSKLTKIEDYNLRTGKKQGIVVFTYLNGSLSRVESFDPVSNSALSRTDISYDAQGRLEKFREENLYEYRFEYDASNRIVRKIGTPILPNLAIDNYHYTYDNNGRLIADTAIYLNGSAWLYRKYTYDASGNVATYQTYSRRSFMGSFSLDEEGTIRGDGKISAFANIAKIMYFVFDNHVTYLTTQNIISVSSNPNNPDSYSKRSYDYYSNGFLRTIYDRNSPDGGKSIFTYQ